MELPFKLVKQHLKIKKFWEDSENAVRIQFNTAIVIFSQVTIVQSETLNVYLQRYPSTVNLVERYDTSCNLFHQI